MSDFLNSVSERAKVGGPERILFVETAPEVVEAARHLKDAGLAEPIMVHAFSADTKEMDAGGLTRVVVDESRAGELEALLVREHSGKITAQEAHELARDPLVYGMYLLKLGEADGLVAGKERTTSDVMRAGLRVVGKQNEIKTVSSSFYMILPPFRGGEKEEVLTFADCGVVKQPTAEQLADIAIAAADARVFVVGDEPHVAFLSYSTKGSGGDDSSIQVVREALKIVQERRPDIKVEGELQADAALIAAVSEKKIGGDSAIGHGKANVLVFPNLDAGNIAYKLVERLVPGARAIGPIGQGFAKPINDLSRGANVSAIVHSALLAALQAKKERT